MKDNAKDRRKKTEPIYGCYERILIIMQNNERDGEN